MSCDAGGPGNDNCANFWYDEQFTYNPIISADQPTCPYSPAAAVGCSRGGVLVKAPDGQVAPLILPPFQGGIKEPSPPFSPPSPPPRPQGPGFSRCGGQAASGRRVGMGTGVFPGNGVMNMNCDVDKGVCTGMGQEDCEKLKDSLSCGVGTYIESKTLGVISLGSPSYHLDKGAWERTRLACLFGPAKLGFQPASHAISARGTRALPGKPYDWTASAAPTVGTRTC